jgi:hypothetical protein
MFSFMVAHSGSLIPCKISLTFFFQVQVHLISEGLSVLNGGF